MRVEKLIDSMIIELPCVVEAGENCEGTPFSSFKIEAFDPENGEEIHAPIPHRLFVSALQLMEAFCGLRQGRPVECHIYGESKSLNIERNVSLDGSTPSDDQTTSVD